MVAFTIALTVLYFVLPWDKFLLAVFVAAPGGALFILLFNEMVAQLQEWWQRRRRPQKAE